LQSITIPVQIVVGDADLIAPKELNAEYYAQNIPTARKLIVLPGERGHYTKPQLGHERPAELQEVSEIAYRFFRATLKLN
jgi:pimeloyl-ACP methyl ester carboxylesterase